MLNKLRLRLWVIRENHFRKKLFKKISKYSETVEGRKFLPEAQYVLAHGLGVFPYPFVEKYDKEDIIIKLEDGFPVVDYLGKAMYFPKDMPLRKVRHYVNDLVMEQDRLSPHSYRSPIYEVDDQDVLIDIGCAEGNYSLEMVDRVKKLYLFEANTNWIDSLNLSFSPWKHKVSIVNERFGAQAKSSNDLIEAFAGQNLLFKIDVDGSEREVLKTIEPIFSVARSIKIAICTYHQNADASEFESYFKSRNFETRFGNGLMLFFYDKKIKPPYFRPGVLFAKK